MDSSFERAWAAGDGSDRGPAGCARSPLRGGPVAGAWLAGLAAIGLVAASTGCARDRAASSGRVSQMQADRYIERAVGQSNEGVVLLPSQVAEREFDRTRMAEIAQNMRRPLAVCFLERAIVTMERGEVDGEQAFRHVPQGQAKLRARLNSSGEVLRVDVLDSSFEDEHMESCVIGAVEKTRFPESRSQTPQWVDVVYWVSLGLYADAGTEAFQARMRRSQAEAAERARGCFEGRVGPGSYEVVGLSLFDREGGTLINRVERAGLDSEVSRCVAQAFKQIRIEPDREAFVRPAMPRAVFTVAEDGAVNFEDARWLELLRLEERAQIEARKAEHRDPAEDPGPIDVERDAISGLVPGEDGAPPELEGGQQGPSREPRRAPERDPPQRGPGMGEAAPVDPVDERAPGSTPGEPGDQSGKKPPPASPGASGIKLDLGSRGAAKPRGGGD